MLYKLLTEMWKQYFLAVQKPVRTIYSTKNIFKII